MSDEEIKSDIEPLVSSLFEYVEVQSVNFKVDGLNGHPFTIGTAHVVEASDHHSGTLTQTVAEKIPCAARDCGRPYSAHTSD